MTELFCFFIFFCKYPMLPQCWQASVKRRGVFHKYRHLQTSPVVLQDGNSAFYPLAKNCIQGVRDPQWLDLLPVHCMSIGVQHLPHVEPPSKNRVAILALALEVRYFLEPCRWCLSEILWTTGGTFQNIAIADAGADAQHPTVRHHQSSVAADVH